MKIRTLEYFVALAESKSINEAAKKVFIAQSGLTKSLQAMEDELGFQLFTRTTSGVQLTPAGKKILPEAKQVISYYHNWKEFGKENSLQDIYIYTFVSFPDFLLPDILLRFRKLHPEINVHFRVTSTPSEYISRSVQNPVIVLTPCEQDTEIVQMSLQQGNDPLILMNGGYRCLVNVRNPLANNESVTLEDLKDYYLAIPEMSSISEGTCFLREILDNITRHSSQRKILSVESVANVLSLVEQDPDVYALSYYPALKRYHGVAWQELAWVPIENQKTEGCMALFYSKQASHQHPILQELVDTICDEAKLFLEEVSNE